ncbi:MAG: xanthine dehydrogenase molybdopterin binding subunit [Candidatus Pelagibacter bacterium]|jgi:xanthine dehydrogenase large subunit|nr:xanthine dehydrogenase molybdopterin binding subunit [Candidatus Pelagibacter bacterium]|tara:strand:- start:1167 stop:3488 length:2322 start_codon:yes stop_codon:yes gene_type:complete
MSKNILINQKIPHDSASKHVSGFAIYTDDIKEPDGTLYGAIGWSKKAHAIIKKIDLSDVWKSEGVISIVTHDDIPGKNDVGPVFDGDPIFPNRKAEYFGQPLFAVAAMSTELARKAVLKAKISYKDLRPTVTIKEALNKKKLLIKVKKIKKGDPSKKIFKSKNYLKGNFTTGSQEHFYLEGQVAFAIPKEDKDLLVYSSTQHPSETQKLIARMLNQKSNTITVVVRRIGGGFGGKETNFLTSSICALLANKTNKPVKLRLDRDDDIIITGKRHEFYSEYEVGFDDSGVIQGLKMKLASKCGISPDLSHAINERALLHIDNAYYLSDVEVQNYLCKTNTATSTAFRGFGGNQGMMAIENIIDNISRHLNKDPCDVRRRNFYQKNNKNITHYGMKIEDNVINEIFNKLIKKSNYKARYSKIKKFNLKSKHLKKGLAITPVKFGISFTTIHLNQAGALVHIYTDGSVYLNHGGIEMGQGTHTKIAQLVANEFGLLFEKIKISSTNTSKVANTSASAASSTTDLNGAAALNAVSKIKNNLENFIKSKYNFISNKKAIYEKGLIKFGKKSFYFEKIIKEAYLNRISLSSSGFYSTPKIKFDKKAFMGRPFLYFCYGAAVTEVTIDTLTGENIIDRVDILHDAGKAINSALELGQIEGGFVQGQGWLTMEEVNWKPNGQITTFSPSTYKIPAVSDIPKKFNVEIFKEGKNKENVVNKAKTTGEPPLMLAMSVFYAIKDAIASVGKYKKIPTIDAPATPEKILMSINELKNRIKYNRHWE